MKPALYGRKLREPADRHELAEISRRAIESGFPISRERPQKAPGPANTSPVPRPVRWSPFGRHGK